MLKPIPVRILKNTVTFHVCAGMDVWQNPEYTDIVVKKVCIQPTNETRKTASNTEVVLRSVLFIDAERSDPDHLDVNALKQQSEANGHPLTLTYTQNSTSMEYTVLSVDTLYDDTGDVHHVEVGLT